MDSIQTGEKHDYVDENNLKVAYALNLCMVSVSQIIDYDDIYILEQEYDSILNNLNLEEMPKDEALLDVLKQLLNVITYFRIQEGDKAFIEQDYQQKMADAIWSAVPNLSVVVAGGSLVTMAASLVAQVGIGYMNYRRQKSIIQLEREKERWKLQRSAIEQFNGLRRELFDTAWRLADAYHFPDAYRITERQISRYNTILLDTDYLRRYERLASIADKFEAYPPFLYFWGNAANMVCLDPKYDDATRFKYRVLACQHFEKFLNRTEHNLLREDHLLASCALEYFDLLTLPGGQNTTPPDHSYLESLLTRAINASGGAFDVLQLCAASYLKIDSMEKAAALLRMLINENYNPTVNAQLLSSLYVARYIQQGDEAAKADYLTLRTRVAPELLFPLPQSSAAEDKMLLQANFIAQQKKLLARKYSIIVTSLMEKYTILFNRTIPAANEEISYPDRYFDNASETRKQDILALFDSARDQQEYILRLSEAHIETHIIQVLNNLYSAVCELPCMKDRASKKQFYDLVKEQILQQQPKFNVLLSKIYYADGNVTFDRNDCHRLLGLSLFTFTGKAFDQFYDVIVSSIKSLTSMYDISLTESQLQSFCVKHGLAYPSTQFSSERALAETTVDSPLLFDEQLLGRQAFQLKHELELAKAMADCVSASRVNLLPPEKSPFKIYVRGDDELIDYIGKDRTLREFGQDRIVAVIDQVNHGDKDLVLTTHGVCPYFRTLFMKSLADPIEYGSVKYISTPVPTLQLGEYPFIEKKIDLRKLFDLMHDLASIQRDHEKMMQALPGTESHLQKEGW